MIKILLASISGVLVGISYGLVGFDLLSKRKNMFVKSLGAVCLMAGIILAVKVYS